LPDQRDVPAQQSHAGPERLRPGEDAAGTHLVGVQDEVIRSSLSSIPARRCAEPSGTLAWSLWVIAALIGGLSLWSTAY